MQEQEEDFQCSTNDLQQTTGVHFPPVRNKSPAPCRLISIFQRTAAFAVFRHCREPCAAWNIAQQKVPTALVAAQQRFGEGYNARGTSNVGASLLLDSGTSSSDQTIRDQAGAPGSLCAGAGHRLALPGWRCRWCRCLTGSPELNPPERLRGFLDCPYFIIRE